MPSPRLEGVNEQLERAKLFLSEAANSKDPVDRLRRFMASNYFARAIAEIMFEASEKQEMERSRDELNLLFEQDIPHFRLLEKIRIHDFHRFGILHRAERVFVGGPIKLKVSGGVAALRIGSDGFQVITTGQSEVNQQRPLITSGDQVFDEESNKYLSFEEVLTKYLAAVPAVIAKVWPMPD